MLKKRHLGYYVDTDNGNNWVLDLDKHHIYCHFHIEQRLYEDENGFIVCKTCNEVIGQQ